MNEQEHVVDRQEWLDAALIVGSGIVSNLIGAGADQFSRPILDSYCFDGEYMWSFNGEQAVRIALKSPIKGAIQARVLMKVLSSYSGDKLVLTMLDDGATLQVGSEGSAPRSRTTLPCLPDKEILFRMPEPTATEMTSRLDKDLVNGFTKVAVSLSKFAKDANQTGVTLSQSEGIPVLYSTDNDSMSRYMLPEHGDLMAVQREKPLVFPKKFVEQLEDTYKSAISGVEDIPDFYVMRFIMQKKSPSAIVVDFGAFQLYTLLLVHDAKYDFEKLFSHHLPTRVAFTYPVPERIDSVLGRALVLQHHAIDKIVSIKTEEEEMVISCQGPDGQMEDHLDLGMTVPKPLDVRVDTQTFQRACGLGYNFAFLPNCFGLFDGEFTHLVAYTKN